MNDRWYYKSNRLQQLKGFCMVVKYGTVKEASDRMFITPSSITKQVQSLEKELGVKLFTLKNKKLELTYEGNLFYQKVSPFLEASDGLFKNFKNFSKETQNRIVIGSHSMISVKMLPQIIAELKIIRPECNIVIKNLSKKDAIEALNSGEVDCIIYQLNKSEMQSPVHKIIDIHIKDYDEVLIVGKDHQLATKDNISIEDLQNAEFFILKDNIAIPEFKNFVTNHDLKSTIDIEGGSWTILKSLVENNLGVTMLDRFYVENEPNIIIKKNTFFTTDVAYHFCFLENNM